MICISPLIRALLWVEMSTAQHYAEICKSDEAFSNLVCLFKKRLFAAEAQQTTTTGAVGGGGSGANLQLYPGIKYVFFKKKYYNKLIIVLQLY